MTNICTKMLAGGTMQSGTITDIDSRVWPANTNVPNTAKSAVSTKRRFADNGSNPISASSCPNAFRRIPSPSVSSVNEPVYRFTGGRGCCLIAITADGTSNMNKIRVAVIIHYVCHKLIAFSIFPY